MGTREHNADGKKLSRRGLLAASAGGVAAIAVDGLAGPMAAFGASNDPLGPSVNGTVQSTRAPNLLVLESIHPDLKGLPPEAELTEGSEVVLTIADGAALWRSGPVELDEFQSGDQVIAYVAWTGDGLVAQAVEPLYTAIEGLVSSSDGVQLTTDQGTVLLSDHTLLVDTGGGSSSATSLSQIRAGMRIFATCRYDQDSNAYIANTIGAAA